MGDYERSTTVDVDRDRLFEYLSKVENLPQYMERMTQAHSEGGDEVSVDARIPEEAASASGESAGSDGGGPNGGGSAGGDPNSERTVHGQAWFRIDADNRTLTWGSEGPNDYNGALTLDSDGGATTVTVTLHTLHDDADAIEHGIDETLANIQRIAASDPSANPGTSTS